MYHASSADKIHVSRVVGEDGYASEDTFYVTAEERVSLKMHNRNVPYVTSTVRCRCTQPPGAVGSVVIINISVSVQQGVNTCYIALESGNAVSSLLDALPWRPPGGLHGLWAAGPV